MYYMFIADFIDYDYYNINCRYGKFKCLFCINCEDCVNC